MNQIITISLENEMDLVLAHRQTMKVCEKLGLTISTQTTFATAVSEVVRTVIEFTDNGNLQIGIVQNNQRYSLKAYITFFSDIKFSSTDEGFFYAQKLVPEFNLAEKDGLNEIEMIIGIPRSLKLDRTKITLLKDFFLNEPPLNAYDELKKRNINLNKIAWEQEEEIRRSKIIDEKKNEFISIASHEIKTPITIIKAYSQIVKTSKEPISEKTKMILEKIDHQSSKLLFLVQQLLDVSKIEHGSLVYTMEKTPFSPFVVEMVSVMKHIIADHEIITNLCDDVDITIDKLRMEQVFSNLIGNAAKYSNKNTSITVNCSMDDDNVVVAVSDQGIGMSANSMRSIFEKFYRDKDVQRSHSGLGMGLYIASKIITDHGGKIWAESAEGMGSTFYFTLPRELPMPLSAEKELKAER